MSDYPDNEQDRKKAIAAQESFCKPTEDAFAERTKIKKAKSDVDELIKQVDVKDARVIEFLHNATWHLTQALKIIDEVES